MKDIIEDARRDKVREEELRGLNGGGGGTRRQIRLPTLRTKILLRRILRPPLLVAVAIANAEDVVLVGTTGALAPE